MPLLIFLLCVCSLAQAGPALDPALTYGIKKESREAGPEARPPENRYWEAKTQLESFDASGGSAAAQPLLSNTTEQIFRWRKLPKDPDPKAAAEGVDSKTELSFDRLLARSAVRVEGFPKPIQTDADLTGALAGKVVQARGDGKVVRRLEGLSSVRDLALGSLRDAVSRNTLQGLLDEALLLRASGSVSPCAEGLGKKAIGARWSAQQGEGSFREEFDCEFLGWSEAKGGLRVAVVEVVEAKRRTSRRQPNGSLSMAETEGKGTFYYAPATHEQLMKMESRVGVEPAEEEVAKLKARAAPVPRNRTLVNTTIQLYPF